MHRDIKLENLLLDENATVKIIDFGFATIVPPGKKIRVFCGPPPSEPQDFEFDFYLRPVFYLRVVISGDFKL